MEPPSRTWGELRMAPSGRLRSLVGLAAGVGLALALGACGPITATTTLADATVAVEAAQGLEAERYAVYEYTMAVEYLRKAREEEGYSDFQAAVDLANKAREFAEKARTLARNNPERGLPPPADEPAVEERDPLIPSGSQL